MTPEQIVMTPLYPLCLTCTQLKVACVVDLCVRMSSEQDTNTKNRNKVWSKLLNFVVFDFAKGEKASLFLLNCGLAEVMCLATAQPVPSPLFCSF